MQLFNISGHVCNVLKSGDITMYSLRLGSGCLLNFISVYIMSFMIFHNILAVMIVRVRLPQYSVVFINYSHIFNIKDILQESEYDVEFIGSKNTNAV